MTTCLYSQGDVKDVREKLLKEQKKLDALTRQIIPDKQAVLDHDHSSMFVRAVLHRQVNAALGKIENIWSRYLAYNFEGTLPDFLRLAADYLEREPDMRWYHPHWIRKVNTAFNKLKESEKDKVLVKLNSPKGSNAAERKKLFQQVVLGRIETYDTIMVVIQEVKS